MCDIPTLKQCGFGMWNWTRIFQLVYTVLYCTVLYCTVLYCTILYCTVLYCIVLYCTVLYCTVLYCTVLYCTVLYCTVLYYFGYLTCLPALQEQKPFTLPTNMALLIFSLRNAESGGVQRFFFIWGNKLKKFRGKE